METLNNQITLLLRRGLAEGTIARKVVYELIVLVLLLGCQGSNESDRLKVKYYAPQIENLVESVELRSEFGNVRVDFSKDGAVIRTETTSYDDREIIISSSSDCGIESIGFVRDSILDGPYIEFHANNRVYFEALYEGNRLMTIFEMFDGSGNRLNHGNIKAGTGLVRMYSADGRIERFGNYQAGLRQGFWKFVTNTGHMDSVLYVDDSIVDH